MIDLPRYNPSLFSSSPEPTYNQKQSKLLSLPQTPEPSQSPSCLCIYNFGRELLTNVLSLSVLPSWKKDTLWLFVSLPRHLYAFPLPEIPNHQILQSCKYHTSHCECTYTNLCKGIGHARSMGSGEEHVTHYSPTKGSPRPRNQL